MFLKIIGEKLKKFETENVLKEFKTNQFFENIIVYRNANINNQ